jgi:hypothetical protein
VHVKSIHMPRVLDGAYAHRAMVRKRVTRLLRFEPNRVDAIASGFEAAVGVKSGEIDDPFAGATRHRGAAYMFH